MLALRYAALLSLMLWVGGTIALGAVAAPAVFDVIHAAQGDGGQLAGSIFGETLRRFHLIVYACAAVLIGTLLVRAILGPRPRRFAIRMSIAALMLAASAWSGMIIAPQIERTRREIGVSPSSLPENDPRRRAFGRLHGISTGLEMLPILGGLALIWWETRD